MELARDLHHDFLYHLDHSEHLSLPFINFQKLDQWFTYKVYALWSIEQPAGLRAPRNKMRMN